MIGQENRSYEISIWTLQDDFITILKYADINHKGQVQDGELVLNIDGTQEFSFSIPMYYTNNGILIENPAWYNYINGNVIANMRKIKLILNKFEEEEDIYEFLITKVTERHEDNELFCDVECEGLAFHELGKTGYKITLTPEDFYTDDLCWYKNEKTPYGEIITAKPKANLQYWMNKFMTGYSKGTKNPAIWYYTIQMDWSAYTSFNGTALEKRYPYRVYEDEYISSWATDPPTIEYYKEKERLINISENNKYNITQEIAEKFGVYCKYIYEHDSNYRITARKVVFYNNFIEEDKGPIDITYKYNTDNISRESDSTELVTKMYVKSIEDNNNEDGYINILNTPANKSKEDYLLNFDYMHSIGAIDDATYSSINIFENTVQEINNNLYTKQEQLVADKLKLPKLEAQLKNAQNSQALATERISDSERLLNNLINQNTGVITIDEKNPDIYTVLESYETSGIESNSTKYKYINISKKGINNQSNFKLYKTFDYAHHTLSDEIINFIPQLDTEDFYTKIKLSNVLTESIIYATYDYNPQLYYKKIKTIWENRLNIDLATKITTQAAIQEIKNRITENEAAITDLIKQKNKLINEFEQQMGAALREGYWQPDDYTDYGDIYNDEMVVSFTKKSSSKDSAFFTWDNKLFEDEQNIYYEVGADQTKKYYPCINLSSVLDKISSHITKEKGVEEDEATTINRAFSFLYYDYEETENKPREPKFLQSMALDSRSKLGFIISSDHVTVIPVLILTGASELTDETATDLITNQIAYMIQRGEGFLGTIETSVDNEGNYTVVKRKYADVDSSMWINWDSENQKLIDPGELVFPRIGIPSLRVKTSEDQLSIKYSNKILSSFSDYYTLIEAESGTTYITLKPEIILRNPPIESEEITCAIRYAISNADTAIYLDAKEVLKDSSYPQVSYTLDLISINKNFVKKTSKLLNRIVHINDLELKFSNVQGYISKVTLKLDEPWEDKIEIKNYKTKFEDLFTKIVASTSQMQKNEYVSGIVSRAFSSDGLLNSSILTDTLNNTSTLNYSLNNNLLKISNAEGITAINSNGDGAITLNNNGIFASSSKNEETDNWQWFSVITSEGINTNTLTSGQIDTNKIKIFSGDNLKFQWNEDGIFAYKTFFNENIELNNEISQITEEYDQKIITDIDCAQYLKLNQDGLFLIIEDQAKILNDDKTSIFQIQKNNFKEDTDDNYIKRVSISWDGLTLRNYFNEKTFYANATTGDLVIKGTINATSGWVGAENTGWLINTNGIQNNLGTIGLNANAIDNNDPVIWAGAIKEDAPFKVSKNGKLYVTGAEISGDTIINTTGEITIASGDNTFNINSETGFQLTGIYNVLGEGQPFHNIKNTYCNFYVGTDINSYHWIQLGYAKNLQSDTGRYISMSIAPKGYFDMWRWNNESWLYTKTDNYYLDANYFFIRGYDTSSNLFRVVITQNGTPNFDALGWEPNVIGTIWIDASSIKNGEWNDCIIKCRGIE